MAAIALSFPAISQSPDPSAGHGGDPARILVLNSYHRGYSWSDSTLQGIEETLRAGSRNIEIWTEYMDTKRYPGEEHRTSLFALYRQKYSGRRFDAVIASDNNALTFALSRRRDLFRETPIVFCGINRFDPAMIAGHNDVTGITEEADLAGALDIARKLLPEATKVVVDVPRTASGSDYLLSFRELAAQLRGQMTFEFWIDGIVEDVIDDLQTLGPETIFFTLDVGRTADGEIVTSDEKSRRISAAAPVPVFVTTDNAIGNGTIGGRLESGYAQGETAARFALDILGGTPAGDIPVMTKSPNRDIFDFNVLQRFGIPKDRLPEGSSIINQPVPAYDRYRSFVMVSIAIVFTLGVFITILIFNVGRRRWAEAAMKESEGRLRALIDHSPAAIYVKDTEGRYLIANDEYRKRYGLAPQDVIGKRAHDFLRPEMADRVTTFDELVFSTRETQTDEIIGYYADGSMHTHKLVKFPIFDSRGDLSGLGCVSTDITDIKDAHEAAQRLQAEIAHVSRLSTMGEMAAGFAHELNQPLTAISNFAAGCLRRIETAAPVAEAIRPALTEISAQALRAGEIIRRIRGFVGKKDMDRIGGKLPEIDLNDTIQNAVGLIEHDATEHDVRLHLKLSPDLPRLRGDSIQIQQVVVNLARNGIDAMSESDAALRVLMIETALIDGRFAQVSVSDTGPGLPEEIRDSLFEPFFTTKAAGMGMGLSICQSIVEQNGGGIEARSREGGGAEFRFHLPLRQADEPAREVAVTEGLAGC